MKVKVGDTVKVIAGADKGKTGKVIKTLKTEARVVVEGVHIVKKHSKPTSMNDKGGIFEIEAPIHVSNVKVIDEKEAKASKTKEKVETAVVQPKEEDFLLDKTVRCPVCDKEFKTKMVKAGKVKRLEPDADLRPRQQYVDSLKYDVASCPNCGYTSLNRYFEHITMGQIKLIKEQISRNFHPQAPSDDATWDYDKACLLYTSPSPRD